jgi:hypothetical protein
MNGRSVAVGALIGLTGLVVGVVGWGSDDDQAALSLITRTEPVCGLLAANAGDSLARSGRPGLSAFAEPGDPVATVTVAASLQRQREVLRQHRAGFLRSPAPFSLTRALYATESSLCDLALNPRGSAVTFRGEAERLRSEFKSDLAKAELEIPHSAFNTPEAEALVAEVFATLDAQEKWTEQTLLEADRVAQLQRLSPQPPFESTASYGQVVSRKPALRPLPAAPPPRAPATAPAGRSAHDAAYVPSEAERQKALALVRRLKMNPSLPPPQPINGNRPELNLPDTSQIPDYGYEGRGYQRTPSNTGVAPTPNASTSNLPPHTPPPPR